MLCRYHFKLYSIYINEYVLLISFILYLYNYIIKKIKFEVTVFERYENEPKK